MAGKRPAFQFYPGDWLKDPELSSCSAMARGVWMDLLCRMFDSQTPGSVTGTVAQLARMARCSETEMESSLTELDESRASRVTRRGAKVTVTSRRLDREANERKSHADRQKRYRENTDDESDGEGDAKVTFPSSSSSSTSSSEEDKSSSSGGGDDDCKQVQEAWNATRGLPQCQVLSAGRRKLLMARLKDRWWCANWQKALSLIPQTPFLLGQNERRWKADFDWFLKSDSALRICEHKYGKPGKTSGHRQLDGLRHAEDVVEDGFLVAGDEGSG